jgi:hypothetical protein
MWYTSSGALFSVLDCLIVVLERFYCLRDHDVGNDNL